MYNLDVKHIFNGKKHSYSAIVYETNSGKVVTDAIPEQCFLWSSGTGHTLHTGRFFEIGAVDLFALNINQNIEINCNLLATDEEVEQYIEEYFNGDPFTKKGSWKIRKE